MDNHDVLAPEARQPALPASTFLQVAQGMQPRNASPPADMADEEAPLGRRARERSQRRREILDVARQHFAKHGFTGTTLDEIARQAEFAKPTLYQFFTSKEHLFHSILADGYQDLLGILRKSVVGEGGAALQLRALCVMFLIYYRKHLDFFVMHRQFQHRLRQPADNPWHHQSQRLHEEMRDRIRNVISRGMDLGELHRLDADRLCATFLETLNVYTQAFQDGGELRTATEMADEIMNLFMNGLSSRR
ncbi:MAG: TetR/AcrR family transcriptional regulator [bacterium]|jgi:AcrR family transcriptional regulator|nr:TetR/AcrR family transcriptional regulator [bacterium]